MNFASHKLTIAHLFEKWAVPTCLSPDHMFGTAEPMHRCSTICIPMRCTFDEMPRVCKDE